MRPPSAARFPPTRSTSSAHGFIAHLDTLPAEQFVTDDAGRRRDRARGREHRARRRVRAARAVRARQPHAAAGQPGRVHERPLEGGQDRQPPAVLGVRRRGDGAGDRVSLSRTSTSSSGTRRRSTSPTSSRSTSGGAARESSSWFASSTAGKASHDAPAYELVEDLFAHADEILAREEYAGIEDAPSFHTKLAGVTFEGRQDVLARLASGTPLRLERQPDNQFDANAIALFDPRRGSGRLPQPPAGRRARAGDRRRRRLRRRGHRRHRRRGRPFARRERARLAA